jgi:Domain of unknown function (DUF4314)
MTISINSLVGKRIKLIKMYEDPFPVEPGQCGTVYHVGADVLNVKWDNGRSLGVIVGVDEFEVIGQ